MAILQNISDQSATLYHTQEKNFTIEVMYTSQLYIQLTVKQFVVQQ